MTNAEDLFEAYRRTSFFADTPRGRLRLRIGEVNAGLGAVLEEFGTRSWAYVTAVNPHPVILTVDENHRRQRQLEETLTERGYVWFPGEGVGDDQEWPAEASALILGMTRPSAIELGRHFGQIAIVFGRRERPAELVRCG